MAQTPIDPILYAITEPQGASVRVVDWWKLSGVHLEPGNSVEIPVVLKFTREGEK